MTNDSNKPLETVGDEALEARIVAWVLGDASAFEEAELEQLCEKDPEVALFVRRMRMLDGLIRDKADEPWKLPDEKRAKVLEVLGDEEEECVRLEAPQGRRKKRTRGRPVRRRLLAIAVVLVLLVVLGGLSAPMVLRQQKSLARMKSTVVSYSAPGSETIDLMEVAEAEANASGREVLPKELIEGTPKPILLPQVPSTPPPAPTRSTASGVTARSGEKAKIEILREMTYPTEYEPSERPDQLSKVDGTVTPAEGPEVAGIVTAGNRSGDADSVSLPSGGLRSGDQAVARDSIDAILNRPKPKPEPGQPAAPSSSVSKAIAANTASPDAIPVPEEAKDAVAFFSDDDEDFGTGWGGGGGGSPQAGDVPMLGRLFDQRENGASVSGEGSGSVTEMEGFVNYGSPILGDGAGEAPAMDPFAPPDSSLLGLKKREAGWVDEAAKELAAKNGAAGGGIEGEVHVGYHNMYEFRFTDFESVGGDRGEAGAADQPVRTNPAMAEGQAEKVDEVRRKLYEGGGNYELGKFDEAKQAYQDVLKVDPYNKAARRGMEKVNAAKSDYYKAAYDNTRAELLAEVDAAWEGAVPMDSERASRGAGGLGGYTEERQALDAAERYAELEAEKIKLESQIDTLLRYDGDQLTTYAAGLNLPENVIKETHPKLLEAQRQLAAAKLEGLGASHPEMRDRKAEVERLKEQVEEGTTELRETLRSQLELVKEQSERLKLKKDKEESETVTHGIARYSFEDARSDFESAQSLLEKLKVKRIGEELQRRISEDPVVVHEDVDVADPGFLSFDRRHRGRSVLQVRPRMPSTDVLPGYVSRDPTAGSPTFFPTEFEVIKSQKTLKKAIEIGGLRELTGKSEEDLIRELSKELEVENVKGTDLIEIEYRDHDERVTQQVVEAVSDAYRQRRKELENKRQDRAMEELREAVRSQEDLVEEKRKVLTQLIRNEGVIYSRGDTPIEEVPEVLPKPDLSETLDLMAEVAASEEPFSTFSLHVSDASFKLASAALQRGERPEPEGIRPEEFYNAFDYGDPAPSAGEPVACALEQAAHPAFPQRNLLRIAVRAGASGRAQSVPLNVTLLLDNSGSMERDDRAEGVARAVDQLSSLLKPGDTVTVAGFSRTPRLLADRLDGGQAAELNDIVRQVPAEGGTNLEQALILGEELATRQFVPGAQNRMVLFTDGAANLGDADPESLNTRVETMRQNGIAFDAAGFGADGLNDRLLERLTRNGNGRYYVVDDPSEADEGFAKKLAGAFRPAAENVKVQVVFNPERVGNYKLIGFEEHRLKKEDFRDDTVDAAEMASEEAGVALYQMEVLPQGRGEIGEVRVRFRDVASGNMVERSWTIPYESDAPAFDQAAESLQLATLAALAAEKLRDAPMAGAVDFRDLASVIGRVTAKYEGSKRVDELRRMIEALR